MSRFFDLLVATEVYADVDAIMSPDEDGKSETIQMGYTVTGLTIDWGDGTTTTAVNGNNTHTYTSAGDYRVRILGNCDILTYCYFSNSDVSLVNNYHLENASALSAFSNCYKLTRIVRMRTPNAKRLWYAFSYCRLLTHLPDDWSCEPSDVVHMFFYCQSLVRIPSGVHLTSSLTSLAGICFDCRSLTNFFSVYDLSNVTNANYSFRNCSNLVWTPNPSDFWERQSPQISYRGDTFYNCTSLTNYVDISTSWKDGNDSTILYQPPNE